MRAFGGCRTRPPLGVLAAALRRGCAALRRGCEWPQREERGDFARPRKFPNFGSSVRLSARALAGEELRLGFQLPRLGEPLARGGDVSRFGLDAGGNEPEPPVGLVVLDRVLNGAVRLVDPPAEFLDERDLKV